jgi:hypothetical protein
VAKFGDVLFSGSRFIFWGLSPFLLFFAVYMTSLEGPWSATNIVVVSVLDVSVLLLILALYDRKRFWWAGRGVTSLVFLTFLAYLADEIHSGKPWTFGSRSESTPLNALLGLLFFGLPCLRYTILGRFGSHNEIVLGIRSYLSGPCPNCGKPLKEHDWAMFAGTAASEKNKPRLNDFFNKVQAHDWRSLGSFSDWEATQNNMEAYAVRCSSGGMVFVLWSPYELYESDQVYLKEKIPPAEMSEIEKLVPPTSWQVAPATAK